MFAVANSFTGKTSLAEDAVFETFMALWRHPPIEQRLSLRKFLTEQTADRAGCAAQLEALPFTGALSSGGPFMRLLRRPLQRGRCPPFSRTANLPVKGAKVTTSLHDSNHIEVTFGAESCSVQVTGRLDGHAVARLSETLRLIPVATASISLRLSSTAVGPGALVLLRHALQHHRAGMTPGCRLNVWADDPALRDALPSALLYAHTDAAAKDAHATAAATADGPEAHADR